MKFQILLKDLYFLFLFIVTLTLSATMTPGVQWNSLSIILLGTTWLFRIKKEQLINVLKGNKLFFLFLLLFTINFIGLAYTSNLKNGNHEVEVKLSLIVLPLIILSVERLSNKKVNILLFTFVLTVMKMIIITLLLIPFHSIGNFGILVNNLVLHRPYLGMYITLAMSIVLFSFRWRTKLTWIFSLGLLFFFTLSLIYIQAKMAMVAIILVFPFVFFLLLFNNKRYGLIFFLFLSTLSVLFYIYNKSPQVKAFASKAINLNFSITTEANLFNSFYMRSISWQCAKETLLKDKNWIVGVGTGDVKDNLRLCYKNKNEYLYKTGLNSHNEYLEEWLRHGIIGLLLFIILLFYSLFLSIRKKKYLYTSFIIIFSILSVTEVLLSRQSGSVFFSLFSSIFASQILKK
jgi:O-antigen ligase